VIELRRVCLEVSREFSHCVFFAGQLVFADELEGFASRFLHNHTALEVLRWLQLRGLSLVILPVRVTAGSGAVDELSDLELTFEDAQPSPSVARA
jgi:hypothetical protein